MTISYHSLHDTKVMYKPLLIVVLLSNTFCVQPSTTSKHSRQVINALGLETERESIGRIHLEGNPKCTATLIAPSFVLTAAHCVSQEDTEIIEEGVWTFTPGNGSGVDHQLEEQIYDIHISPEYDNNHFWLHDVAVLELANPLDVISTMDFYDQTPPHEDVAFVGFGCTEELNTVSSEHKMIGSSRIESFFPTYFELDNDNPDFSRVCQGDSGGPTIQSIGGNEYQIAVTSGYAFDDSEFHLSRMTRVDAHVDWIASILDNPSEIPKPNVTYEVNSDENSNENILLTSFSTSGSPIVLKDAPTLLDITGNQINGYRSGQDFAFFIRKSSRDQEFVLIAQDPNIGSRSETTIVVEGEELALPGSSDETQNSPLSAGCQTSKGSSLLLLFVIVLLLGRTQKKRSC